MAFFNQSSEGNSPMDKVKRILSSPMTRKKQAQPKYFGVPLEDILQREGTDVPNLVTKICSFILKNGITQEGIFRVNGNNKVIERLKQSFETTGTANLDNAGDVMAVAAILKMFLRELPEGLVPEAETLEFVRTQEAYGSNKELRQQHLRQQLGRLSRPHYVTLKYLCGFLQTVTQFEASNKMGTMGLGIVFGPNIFRCSLGVQGLKEQGVTNHITMTFIKDYTILFLQKSPSPKSMQNGRKKGAAPPPPRPQPSGIADPHTALSPRKSKQQKTEGTLYYQDTEDTGSIQSSDTRTNTPRYSDDEFQDTGRLSPFPLETDRSEHSRHSSITCNKEVVEKAITTAITEHLFGDGTTSISSDEAPVRPPRRKQKSRNDSMNDSFEANTDKSEEPAVNIRQRIQQFEADSSPPSTSDGNNNSSGLARKQPQSKAFQMFEQKGLVIGPAPSKLMQSLKYGGDGAEIPVESDSSQPSVEESPKPQPKPRTVKRWQQQQNGELEGGDVSELNSIQREEETLTAFKKPAGPKNRRNPTRRSLKGSEVIPENGVTNSAPTPAMRPGVFPHDDNASSSPRQQHQHRSPEGTGLDGNHNDTAKPSTNFLNLHYSHHSNGAGDHRGSSPDKSPSSAPFIPPLDLSILHEHGDGSEAIPVEQGLSISLQKVQPGGTEDKAIISPRSDKIQKKSFQNDPEVPPSPPMEQTKKQRAHRVEDEYSAQVKSLTKKIQTCKRKIKNFEELFEQEHGYRPSQTDKAAKPEVKKYMQDLAKTRKELRRIKEEQEQQRIMMTPGTTGSVVEDDGPAKMEDTLQVLLKRLVEKRRDSSRPEDLMLMNAEQVQEEKLAVQKALLHFENLHGRPATKSEKELMRPLYDRYRNIKRLLSKTSYSLADKTKDSLQTVPEDHTIEFEAIQGSKKSPFSDREAIRIPTAELEEENQTFLVTKDFHLLGDTVKPGTTGGGDKVGLGKQHTISEPLKENVLHSPVREPNKNLHEMTYTQLLEEQIRVKNEKKRLRKILRDFEDEFYENNGEKVEKEDRAPMDVEYRQYKQIKARLKLLEALLSKHGMNPDL